MSRARQVANFDPALFAADEVSGDKVSGGTIGAGVIGASVTGGAGLSGSTSLGTVTAGDISHADIVYPAGHVIYHKIMDYGKASGGINIVNAGWGNTDIVGDFTPKKSSSASFLIFHFYASKAHINNNNYQMRLTATMSATNPAPTTQSENDNLAKNSGGITYYDDLSVISSPINGYFIFKVGTNTVSNQTTYTGGTTYYTRLFCNGGEEGLASVYPVGQTSEWLWEVTEYVL